MYFAYLYFSAYYRKKQAKEKFEKLNEIKYRLKNSGVVCFDLDEVASLAYIKLYVKIHDMNPVRYLIEVRQELGKVSWPTPLHVVKLTGVVILASAIVGGYTGALDYLFANALKLILSK